MSTVKRVYCLLNVAHKRFLSERYCGDLLACFNVFLSQTGKNVIDVALIWTLKTLTWLNAHSNQEFVAQLLLGNIGKTSELYLLISKV